MFAHRLAPSPSKDHCIVTEYLGAHSNIYFNALSYFKCCKLYDMAELIMHASIKVDGRIAGGCSFSSCKSLPVGGLQFFFFRGVPWCSG